MATKFRNAHNKQIYIENKILPFANVFEEIIGGKTLNSNVF